MKVFAALKEDVHQGWVWLLDSPLKSRSVVRISNPATGKKIYCEAMQIDDNFLRDYNNSDYRYPLSDPAHSIVMGGWYRAKLGDIPKQIEIELTVKACDTRWGKFRACLDHPQIVVRVAAWLGAISVGLGLLGAILGALGVWFTVQPCVVS
jgi:hypothetical protein